MCIGMGLMCGNSKWFCLWVWSCRGMGGGTLSVCVLVCLSGFGCVCVGVGWVFGYGKGFWIWVWPCRGMGGGTFNKDPCINTCFLNNFWVLVKKKNISCVSNPLLCFKTEKMREKGEKREKMKHL